ncbi:MAG: UDP-N-acetylmuramoyl-tripeptide--D-alanyl-D-alanine ligase [Phycisphaera sp.]|nr:MAG: UDP-N-acetylmuramoyl-tripeptide--D-alanyl-D-alanine ligase [Phycisphaera sp.]
MTFFTPDNIRSAVGGVFRTRPGVSSISGGVSIDTRTLKPGQVFAAFKGENVDGHAYLHEARAAGSTVALVEREGSIPSAPPEDMTLIEVESTRTALGQLARAYRKTFTSTRVIAVTGSNGKTTTVRLIDQVLGSSMRGSASVKSFNNDIGLPLTLLAAQPNEKYVVCELGMSSPGEVAYLSQIASPDIAVITSIGRAHIEFFEDESGIAQEKASILRALSQGGLGVITADAPLLDDYLPPGVSLLRFGSGEHADIRVVAVDTHGNGVCFETNGGQRYEIGLLGAHNAHNAAAAIAVARRMGMPEADIAMALASAKGPEMRLDRRTIGGITIIDDAYNANPESVIAAIGTLDAAARSASRRVLVLGEMLELGDDAPAMHEEVGRVIGDSIDRGEGPDFVVLVGDLARSAAPHALDRLGKECVVMEPETGDGRSIAERLAPGDAVLLKGSRSVGLERVVHAVRQLTHETTPQGAATVKD